MKFVRNIAVQYLIVTAIDDAHSSFTERLNYTIMTEHLTDQGLFLPHLILNPTTKLNEIRARSQFRPPIPDIDQNRPDPGWYNPLPSITC